MRLRRDKVAVAGGVVVVLLILVAILAPLICPALGHPPNEFHQNLVDPTLQRPKGRLGRASAGKHPLGVEPIERPRHLQPDRLRRPDLAAGRVPRHRCCRWSSAPCWASSPATSAAGWTALISRIDGHLPRLPAAAVRHRDRRRRSRTAFGLSGNAAADRPADLRHRLLQLALHRPHRPRADAVAARAGVRRRRPQPRRPRPVHPLPRTAAEPGRADPGLLHAADPDQHPLRGGAVLPRRRRPAADRRPGATCSPAPSTTTDRPRST